MTPRDVLKTALQVLLTAAAVKAALSTLSRPFSGAGVAPSVRLRQSMGGGAYPVEGLRADIRRPGRRLTHSQTRGPHHLNYEDLL